MLDYLTVGTIINVHGVRGEVKVMPDTDDINRFKKLRSVLLLSGGSRKPAKVESVKLLGGRFVVLKLEGIDDRDTAETMRGVELQIERKDAVKLPEDTYFVGDLIGCRAVEEDGNVLGEVAEVYPGAGSDIYNIRTPKGEELLLPAIGETILEVDIENSVIKVRLLPGLREIYLKN